MHRSRKNKLYLQETHFLYYRSHGRSRMKHHILYIKQHKVYTIIHLIFALWPNLIGESICKDTLSIYMCVRERHTWDNINLDNIIYIKGIYKRYTFYIIEVKSGAQYSITRLYINQHNIYGMTLLIFAPWPNLIGESAWKGTIYMCVSNNCFWRTLKNWRAIGGLLYERPSLDS